MALTDTEFTQMNTDCDAAFASRSVTITSKVWGDFNATTQRRATTDTTASGVAATLQPRRVQSGVPQGMDIEESVYRITATAIAFAPTKGDTLTDGTDVFVINRVEREVNDTVYVLYCSLTPRR